LENLRWIAAAALSAYACHLAVQHTTPIDAALPMIAVAVTLLAWVSYPALMLAVPLFIVVEISLVDEPTRLLAFGAIWTAATLVAALTPSEDKAATGVAAVQTTIVAVIVLRWIPMQNVLVWRELFIVAIAVAIVLVLGRTPFAIAVAVLAALVTPAIPLRTLIVPVVILGVAGLARLFGMPALRLALPSAIVLGFAMLFFAWSGVVARAFPYFLRRPPEQRERFTVAQALKPNQSMTYAVPDGAQSLVVSGANVANLRRGAMLGTIEPGHIAVRIGDAADWGYLRREGFHRAHNPLPRDLAGKLRDYGYAAWVDGAGRVALPLGAREIRVTADASLPPGASLQVEGFE
jgi:hypothetical protein